VAKVSGPPGPCVALPRRPGVPEADRLD
jgi:hypothetical protein